jgi:hypothetical protein
VGLDGAGVSHVGVSETPYTGILSIVDFLTCTQHDLMRNSVLFIRLFIITEGIVSVFQSQVFGKIDVEACFFSIVVAVALDLKVFGAVGNEYWETLDDELIGY